MRQAITTKFLGPTNFRGSRVVAKAQAGKLTLPWDHALDVNDNHDAAARALADKYGWLDECRGNVRMIGGALPDGTGNCYVLLAGEVYPSERTKAEALADAVSGKGDPRCAK